MNSNLTIVLEDHGVLSELCGANDENLKAIEALLGAEVRYKGNEIRLDSDEPAKQDAFRQLIDSLRNCIKSGRMVDPRLVSEVYETLTNDTADERELFANKMINVPGGKKIFPRNSHQAAYIQNIEKNEVVFGIGPAGTGKTYLAVASALSDVLSKKKRRIIITRPVVEAGESLGFLPGDLTQKLSPYLKPIYDAMDSFLPYDVITRMEENRLIEIAPLAYMRGRSLTDSFIILDEAQNTTKTQMKMFLTRIGEGSQAVITGDVTQTDLPKGMESGLIHASSILKDIEGISFNYFDTKDVVRKKIVRQIIQAYEKHG